MRFGLGRRDFMSTRLVAAPLFGANTQVALRIGWLSVSPHSFVAGYRYADGDAARLPALVDELLKVRV